jgi:hypothetical protein
VKVKLRGSQQDAAIKVHDVESESVTELPASLRKNSSKLSHHFKQVSQNLIGSSQEAKSIKQMMRVNSRAKIDAMAMNALGVE